LVLPFAHFARVEEDPRRVVDFTSGLVRIANQLQQAPVSHRPIQFRSVGPCITTARHAQYPTQRGDSVSVTVRVDKATLYSASLAKSRAFFKMSCSSSTRRSWACSLMISTLGFDQIGGMLIRLSGFNGFDPFIQAMLWADTPVGPGHLGYRVATINDLADGFVFKFGGISFCAHGFSSYG
jgi:hypothetical protein